MTLTPLRRRAARAFPGLPIHLLVVGVTFAVAAGAPAAGAQVLYGSIVGHVQDSTGAALPGATVVILHEETRLTRETTSDTSGTYTFTAVPSGRYTVTVTVQGFRTSARPGVPVTLNTVTRVDVALQLGELAETVTVVGESPLLQTDRAEVRAELNEHELRDLPVPLGRNYQRLFKVIPGFTPPFNSK